MHFHPMHFHIDFRTSDSGRLTTAFLFSLVLHALLLFFIRFAQPSWKDTANKTTTLNVILEKTVAEAAQPAGIPQASLHSKGKAKIGVQAATPVPKKTPATVTLAQNNQRNTEPAKVITGEKILALDKPAKLTVAENTAEVQVTKSLPPETTEEKAKPPVPAPSVENLVAKVAPPVEEPKEIVTVEPAQEKPAVEKPVTSAEEPAKVEESKPVKLEEPKPVKIEEPKPIKVEEPNPVEVEKPEPVKIEEPQPVKVEEPKPVKVEEPKPIKVEEPKPAKADEPKSAQIEEPKSVKPEVAAAPKRLYELGKPDGAAARPPAYGAPSQSDFGIGGVRGLPRIADKRIMGGERRKIIGSKEQELRFVMYKESVRLKLQRFGQLNNPTDATQNNLSGRLVVQLSIRADGSLEEVSIVRPSPHEVLNTAAEKVVRMCAPFSPLPDNIRQDTDVLTFSIPWNYENSRQVLE